MSNTISANTLFHFTNSFENILSILENEFLPSYSMERILNFEVAVPMVSFCDIPLSQISHHANYYGRYAIGMSKDWGIKKKINPVFYLCNNTAPYYRLTNLLTVGSLLDTSDHQKTLRYFMRYFNFITFVKSYNGRLWDKNNNEFSTTSRDFYNEREWRFVPIIKKDQPSIPFLFKKDFLELPKGFKLSDYKISFNPDDIKYIIVNKDDEILKMFEAILNIKSKYLPEIKNKLTTKIITMDQIQEDF